MTLFDIGAWTFLAASPILALVAAGCVFNAIWISRNRERQALRDECHESDFRTWWGLVRARGALQKAYCPLSIGGETCYACDYQADFYQPNLPHAHVSGWGHPVFDVGCGVLVGRGWSVLDCFPGVRFVGKGCLCVTDANLYFRGGGADVRIALSDIHTVAAACSSVLVGASPYDRPLLFSGVNGQRLRDTLHLLIGDREEVA